MDHSGTHVDTYSFDDLLVNCTQELMANGLETTRIPETIKDWIGGKLLRALPQRLCRRLLTFILDNKDLDKIMGFREHGDEFTMILYRSERTKRDREKLLGFSTSEYTEERRRIEEEMQLDELNRPAANIFEGPDANVIKLDEDGMQFYAQELLVDQTQVVPRIPEKLETKAASKVVKRPKRSVDEDERDDFSLPVSVSNDGQSSEEVEKVASKPGRQSKNKKNNAKRICPSCDKSFRDLYDLRRHIKLKHHEFYPAFVLEFDIMKKGILKDDTAAHNELDCEWCAHKFLLPSTLKSHRSTRHMDSGQNLMSSDVADTLKGISQKTFKEPKARSQAMAHPSIVFDAHTEEFACVICGYSSTRPLSCLRHVGSVHEKKPQVTCQICRKQFLHKFSLKKHMYTHTGNYPAVCNFCTPPKKFNSFYKLNHEHMPKHHPEHFRQMQEQKHQKKLLKTQIEQERVEQMMNPTQPATNSSPPSTSLTSFPEFDL